MKRPTPRLSAIVLTRLASAAYAETDAKPPTNRPNIVVILGDDHGWPFYGFMESSLVETPHLDTLPKNGTVFPNAYNTDCVCRPALRSILTGLHPQQSELRAARITQRNRATTDAPHRKSRGAPPGDLGK
ncbi:MAG: sulfatase-like hydrolase/transferase [Candidatus Binatia bacterium]|nr:sulfatase-like hydrolase/transferase [Candidatus Binatia bacterium]